VNEGPASLMHYLLRVGGFGWLVGWLVGEGFGQGRECGGRGAAKGHWVPC